MVEIACGGHHSLALTDEGEVRFYHLFTNLTTCQQDLMNLLQIKVFAWGQNSSGQVGSGINTNQNAPRRVNSNLAGKRVTGIACGQSSSIAVTNYGEVYGWGNDSVGQLGTGKYVNQPSPHKVVGLAGVVIGSYNLFIQLKNDEVFSFRRDNGKTLRNVPNRICENSWRLIMAISSFVHIFHCRKSRLWLLSHVGLERRRRIVRLGW